MELHREKRKYSSEMEEIAMDTSVGTSNGSRGELFSKKLLISDIKSLIPNMFYYKNTNDYTKVVAKANSLPLVPEILKINTPKPGIIDNSDTFLLNLISSKSFNTDVNKRFSHEFCNEANSKKPKKSKKKMEKTREEKLRKSIINKEWKLKKKEKKKLLRARMGVTSENESNFSEHNNSTINKVDIYKVSQNRALIFHMHYPSKFSFHGEIKITVINGEVEVLGYTLTSTGKDSADIYSPVFCTPLIVETKPVKQSKPINDVQSQLKEFLTEKDYNELFTKLKADDTILFVEEITSIFGVVINKYFDKLIFPKDLENVSSMTKTLKSLQSIFTFKMTEKGKHFRKNPQWDKIPLGQCTIACGGVGVGKSTLLKYYVNKLCNVGEKALWLDFDPGQPEFTFPGCVSAVIVDQPLLGPNFTHLLDPFLMMSFGDVDVSSNPSKYLECVKYIIENCKKNEELLKMKWFVNTMGFCKGLGISLTISILKLLQPNTVIQIKCSDYKNNYPFYLTSTTLNEKNGFRSMPLNDVELSHDLRIIYSCSEQKKKQIQGGLKRKEIRDIMALSYFSKMLSPPFYNFNAVQPYLISFSKLYLGIDFLIEPNDVLKAFNGNIASLSYFEPKDEEILSVESEGDIYFKVVVKPDIAPSFGIGFVRGIDCQERKFYVITHLSVETLNNVNCLTLGKISPPHSMFLKQETVESQTVYTSSGSMDSIKKVRRMFRVPGTPQFKEKWCKNCSAKINR